MLVRIVRMTFRPDALSDFQAIFDASKHRIRTFPGNCHLTLLRDPNNPAVRMTYSLWVSADALEAYRQSELFRTTWAATKVLFAERAVAFSGEALEEVEVVTRNVSSQN
ncbi:putative quinol monooxygenase [Spirosoma montaniterrae]|uniref:Antibiotic biosynthesis monooxygenase n=1 Tax=Spirosoma montaniterrae TaxID=1178516 RepID=A0A1P9X3R8_9BACT|nr:antibiotic biosynthesis monooxygenase family protein [Spirosoma montaniterrae]AQG82259.1 antibiotic biosynthesis monooxygenase [Spirosoma montaniterrae]